MKLKCNLSILMGRDKLSIQDVVNQTKLARNTVAGLYHETARRIDFETVTRLCELFQCGIADLFEIVNEG